MALTEEIEKAALRFYLESHDFNGIPLIELLERLGEDEAAVRDTLSALAAEGRVRILFSAYEENTHVLRFVVPPAEVQASDIVESEPYHTCIYPSRDALENAVDREAYAGRPYTLALACGELQLAHRSFDLSVLENYRNDPRYYYTNDDVRGSIYARESEDDAQLPERDRVFLQTFGFSYDDDLNRSVATFLRYLSDLGAEHQQLWRARELNGNYRLHPDYFRNTILGQWGERVPILTALVVELFVINQMCDAMGREPMFRRTFGEYGENKPARLSLLIRPTLEEYNQFVLLLDQVLSENINRGFFRNDVPLEEGIVRGDGVRQVQQIGSIRLLASWFEENFRGEDDNAAIREAVAGLREVRRQRQQPAHAINENVFDQEFFRSQRILIHRVYEGVRTIRLSLANHPAVRASQIDIPDWLFEGRIWTI